MLFPVYWYSPGGINGTRTLRVLKTIKAHEITAWGACTAGFGPPRRAGPHRAAPRRQIRCVGHYHRPHIDGAARLYPAPHRGELLVLHAPQSSERRRFRGHERPRRPPTHTSTP